MDINFPAALKFVLDHECVFAEGHDGDMMYVVTEDVPGDSGGLTKFGIDQASHPGVDIAALTLADAAGIYRNEQWANCHCDDLPQGIDTAVFDCAVNNGEETSIRLLQTALNNTGFQLDVDGQIGPVTLAAAAKEASVNPRGLISDLLTLRRARYLSIVNHNPGDAKFLQGWLNRVNDLNSFLFPTAQTA